MGCVYKITNKINNKAYIGYTVRTLKERWQQHVRCAFHEQLDGSYDNALKRAIRKYGTENFYTEVLEFSDDKEYLTHQEKYWIKYYNTCIIFPDSWGYNLTTGGEGGNGCYNSLYMIDIISCNIVKTFFSEQEAVKYYNNTSIYNIVNKPSRALSYNGFTFMRKTLVDNMSKQELQDYIYNRYNIICQLDLNGKILEYFLTVKDASQKTNISSSIISFAITNTRKHGGGYQWCYYKDLCNKKNHKIINTKGNKAVAKIDENDIILETYPSAKIAGEKNNCDSSAIGKVCKGYRKTCGGYKWKYVEE